MDAGSVPNRRDIALSGGEPRGVRRTIRDSWLRARRQGLRPDRYLPPVEFPADEIDDLRRRHSLAQVWPLLRGTLRWATRDQGSLLFLADTAGYLLWVDGHRSDLREAERAHLVPGALWSERAAGTNGVGTALALQRPFQVHGAEHYLSVATGFTCTAVPIRAPYTGEPLGVLDLTSARNGHDPVVSSLLGTAARLAEAELRSASLRHQARQYARYAARLSRRSGTPSALVAADGRVLHAEPRGWLPPRLTGVFEEGPAILPTGRPVLVERLSPDGPFLLVAQRADDDQPLVLRTLGRDHARLHVAGITHELSRRHSELLAVLLANPGGLGSDELRREVYGPSGKTVTLRAELVRLRAIVGHRLASEPYRLTGESRADFLELDADVATGPLPALLDRYPGPPLPSSPAPGVVALRERLHRRLYTRLLDDGDSDSMIRWLTSRHGRGDRQVADALHRLRTGR